MPGIRGAGSLPRGHWFIENKPRWSLDVIFLEDAAQAGQVHAPCEPEYPAENGACPPSGDPRSPAFRQKENDRPSTAVYCYHEHGHMFTILFKK
jgi:hypothetical protein